MSGDAKSFEAAATEVGTSLAAAFDNPETIIRKLAEWARTNYPERVAQAYWFSLDGDRDKGFQIEVMRLPWTFRDRIRISLGALVGAKTVGGNIFANVWQSRDSKWVLSVGVGAVTDYGSLMSHPQWELVGTVALKVKF